MVNISKTAAYGCAAFACFLGVILYVFSGIGGDVFIRTAARITLKHILMPEFKALKKGFETCSAYKDGIVEFKDFKDGKRKYKQADFKNCTGSQTHLYLYHITNTKAVIEGATPVVEKRGPWVFKSHYRDYTIQFNEERKTVSQTGRSIILIDDAETKKLCPQCATDRLCASWPDTATTKQTPTKCEYGKVKHDASNKAYNTITTMNNGYLGLLNRLDVMEPIGQVDEKFIQHQLGSSAANLLLGPGSLLGGSQPLSNIALNEIMIFILTVQGGLSAAFESAFRSGAIPSYPASMQTGRPFNFNQLNLGVNANTTYLKPGAFTKLFAGLSGDPNILGNDVDLTSAKGLGFWILEYASGVCTGNATHPSATNSANLFTQNYYISQSVRC